MSIVKFERIFFMFLDLLSYGQIWASVRNAWRSDKPNGRGDGQHHNTHDASGTLYLCFTCALTFCLMCFQKHKPFHCSFSISGPSRLIAAWDGGWSRVTFLFVVSTFCAEKCEILDVFHLHSYLIALVSAWIAVVYIAYVLYFLYSDITLCTQTVFFV